MFKIFVQTESIVLNHRAIYVDRYIHKVKKKNKIQARKLLPQNSEHELYSEAII